MCASETWTVAFWTQYKLYQNGRFARNKHVIFAFSNTHFAPNKLVLFCSAWKAERKKTSTKYQRMKDGDESKLYAVDYKWRSYPVENEVK
jgi:hypothetical protein